ncbi:Hypothetical protein R9X50_00729800 [Acrodontium crateriforme]|uniref:tRNA wybutosine-synthesizing protein 4 n=1 Tax=Acrodontium crateriforme TaxID=150365 RepID=A0AAQ3M9I3_9PEZI|nr:Hypothetical protein R9X50_00729800 [Acrodontium crateriforme]
MTLSDTLQPGQATSRSQSTSPMASNSSNVPAKPRKGRREDELFDAHKVKRDEFIMDTNNSSIVSKRSVEKLYHGDSEEYFRHFVSKFKRRSPLINRGYWLRMKAIEHGVTRFLAEKTAKRKIVINLGCGYDPLPFQYLGKQPDLCENATFVDVDYPTLMQNKLGIIDKTPELRSLLPNFTRTNDDVGLVGSSDPYVAVGCDLHDLPRLKVVLQDHLRIQDLNVAILFVSEVSTAYMSKEASQAVIQWTASHDDVRFCLLEQHLPDGTDHPFAQTMLTHFQKLHTPLHAIGTIDDMRQRFMDAAWPEGGLEIRTLWELWSDPAFLTAEQRRALDKVEPFDEWEEFALFASHYFLLFAEKRSDTDFSNRPFRNSIMGNHSRASLVPSPTSGQHAFSPINAEISDIPTEHPLQALELSGTHIPRRFAALVPATSEISEGEAVGLLGGMGHRERMTDCDTYSKTDDILPIAGPPIRTGVMCHTITRLGGTSNCLMAGGRTSPDKATAECWLRQDGMWRRSQSLPEGRYRHSAVPLRLPTEPRPAHTVLIFGGKTSDGHVLDEWLLWMGGGWQTINIAGEAPAARFGAAMITDAREGVSGVMCGGMTSAGRVLNDFWHWSLESDMTLYCRNLTARALTVLKASSGILGRFGAQMVRSNSGILMIGGVCGGRMLRKEEEILNMKTLRTHPLVGSRPLFVGSNIIDVDGGLIILGGGATCFSFGTTWTKPCLLTDDPETSMRCGWHLLTTSNGEITESQVDVTEQSKQKAVETNLQNDIQALTPNGTTKTSGPAPLTTPVESKLPDPAQVPRASLAEGIEFERFLEAGKPTVFSDGDIGPCTSIWNDTYLKESIGNDRAVVVHAAPSSGKMDFTKKNFDYVTKTFGSFIDEIQNGEKLYLRSVSKDAPTDRPTNLADDYPEIAADFELPGELIYVVENLHSSPLRIAGPITMWLHYDVMANVLCQVRGRKRVRLYPPSDVSMLGFQPGASSSALDVWNATATSHPHLQNTHPHETILTPGDILFIPPMWVHSTTHAATSDIGMSVSVNIFFRSLGQASYAAGRDVYGNRDLAAYERGRKDIARIIRSFDELPPDVSGFYLERLGHELLEKGKGISRSATLHSVYTELS